MVDLPDGVVTFLFTDIEGSTRLLQQRPDALKAALLRHNELLSAAIEAHHGRVFETVGDAYYAVFAHATDAVAAALDCQLCLNAEPWDARAPIRARMSLHTGDVERRETKYFGAPLFRSARLLSTAHGGQVVLSATTADLVLESLPLGTSLRDMGEHRLRDLTRRERIWQLIDPRLPADFPPLRSLTTLPNNLPAQLTTFIGRDREIGDIRRLLATTRIFTLVGAGGAGKTRLSIQVGAEVLHDYPDGVWLVELAPLTDPDLVAGAIAKTMGVRESATEPILTTLNNHLRGKKLLLVLDNCEHVIASCARVVEAILHSCSQVQILATSREALGVPGEVNWRVPSLSVPSPKRSLPAEQVTQFDAVRLFVDRAVSVMPGFSVTNRNAPAVAQICWRLDGIPLAIELAASRVRALTVDQISARLDDRFKLLTGGSRTALPRQQTLRALIDWSHDLLSEPERVVFRRLSVFSGGFSLEAAEAVCGSPDVEYSESDPVLTPAPQYPIPTEDVLDLLTMLVEKSLVLAEEVGEATRYGLPESVRRYALDRLILSGELATIQRRHAIYYVEFVEAGEPLLSGPDRSAQLLRIENEYDNLRAVYVAGRDSDGVKSSGVDLVFALRLVTALRLFWIVRGAQAEGFAWTEAVLPRAANLSTIERARALISAGLLAGFLGKREATRARSTEAVTLCRQLGDKRELGWALILLSAVSESPDSLQTQRDLQSEGTAAFSEIGDLGGLAVALRAAAMAAFHFGDPNAARSLTEESVRQFYALGDVWMGTEGLNALGDLARDAGDDERATSLYQETLSTCREQGLPGMIPSVLQNLGWLALRGGKADEATRLLDDAIAFFQGADDQRGVAECLSAFGGVATVRGSYERAARLFGAADAAFTAAGVVMWMANRAEDGRNRARVHAGLGDDAFETLFTDGQAMSCDQAVAFARASTA